MHDLSGGIAYCPECGRAYGSVHAEPFALKPGTILNGKYLMGEMLGQGGFGITYIGLDLLLQQKVAIKEYFPTCTGMVSRENRSTVVWSSAMVGKTGTQRGFDSFLKEARKMAKLGGIPNVVGVKSVFTQNETAYIVMDFIEGETLQQKMQKNGPMDFDSCIRLMTPIMQSLAEVHKHGIIHRDISPDNIMVQPDGKPVLLDLGAAKDLDIQGKDGSIQTTQMVAKQGFSPIEQYRKNASVGPWTDVYSMAATIYYCCTGTLPPTSVDRIVEDTLTCKPRLTKEQFDVLAAGMSILPQKRPQDMARLAANGHPPAKRREGRAGQASPAGRTGQSAADDASPSQTGRCEAAGQKRAAEDAAEKAAPRMADTCRGRYRRGAGNRRLHRDRYGKSAQAELLHESGRHRTGLAARACGNHAQGNHAQSNRAQGHGTQARTHYEAYTAQELYRICGWLLGKHKSERRELQSECPRAGFLHPAGTMQGNDRQYGSIHERGNKVQRMAGVGKSERAVPENRQALPARR